MVPLIGEDIKIPRKYPDVKQIPFTHSPQLFYTKIMGVVSAALFSIIAIVLVIYFYEKRKTKTHEKGMFIGLCFIFF